MYPTYDDIPILSFRRLAKGINKGPLITYLGANPNSENTNTNQRGESLLEYLISYDLEILNKANDATFS